MLRASQLFLVLLTGCCLLLTTAACENRPDDTEAAAAETPAADVGPCDDDNGGLTLPDGFCAVVVAEDVGPARHLVVTDDGALYVALRNGRGGETGGILALRDTSGDYRADVTERFGFDGGSGIDLHGGFLYFATDTSVVRYRLPAEGLVPEGEPERVVDGFVDQGQHAAKTIALDESGGLYVNVGAPSNACQQQMRTPGSPGQDPCPQLDRQGGIWRFDANATGQTQTGQGQRFATGIRNAVALAWKPGGTLYAAQHGRDQLSQLWPDLYTTEQNAELPAEELFAVQEGDDFGWPFCYYDWQQNMKVLAPEYGGDGQEVGRCVEKEDPVVAFPGHWAPNDLLFYSGTQFPARYQGGAFIAFHGSWNRAPLPQQGYNVAFVPFNGGQAAGEYEIFADGFKGAETLQSPGDATYRPMGLALGPDGALYIADSVKGRIWRVVYRGA